MQRLGVIFLLLVAVVGCTRPNPRSCGDGLCSDQAFPFCDVDGTLGGSPQECIAVACNADTFEACRGDIAITCNQFGTDFDLLDCPLGCESGLGCKECSVDAECTNPTPVCDGARCRPCSDDDECPSRVCDLGSCVLEAEVVYGSPTGSNTTACSLDEPCTAGRVVSIASQAVPQPIVRMLPGVYPQSLLLDTPTIEPLEIVATGATFVAFTALEVTSGATASIRGLELVAQNFAVDCGDPNTARSSLTLTDSVLRGGNDSANLITGTNCAIDLSTSEMLTTPTGAAMTLGNDAALTGDRLHVHGSTPPRIAIIFRRVSLTITNSLLEDVQFIVANSDTEAPGSNALIAFNTLVLTSPANNIACPTDSNSPFRNVRFENNILFANGTQQPVISDASDCTFTNNVISPQPSSPPNNTVADPQFVDMSAKNFRVLSSSPAVNAADVELSPSGHDFDGVSRPQGAGPDIGAFEQ